MTQYLRVVMGPITWRRGRGLRAVEGAVERHLQLSALDLACSSDGGVLLEHSRYILHHVVSKGCVHACSDCHLVACIVDLDGAVTIQRVFRTSTDKTYTWSNHDESHMWKHVGRQKGSEPLHDEGVPFSCSWRNCWLSTISYHVPM